MIASPPTERRWRRGGFLALLPAAALLWAYGPTLGEIVHRWMRDPQYTHGFLVPLFAGFLLWQRRDRLAGQRLSPNWWGLLIVLAGVGLRLLGAYLYIDWLVGLSLLPTLAGFGLLLGGWPVLRWSWPAVAFLFFMVPLPYRLHAALGGPLQRVATVASTYVLQTLGFPALRVCPIRGVGAASPLREARASRTVWGTFRSPLLRAAGSRSFPTPLWDRL